MPKGKKTPPEPPPLPQRESSDVESDIEPDIEPDVEPITAGDRSEQFHARAGAVIALDRGINARSRVKLAVIAEELELSEDEFAAAMSRLQGGEDTVVRLTKKELGDLRRRKRAFENLVGETLMALPQGVLTSSMEQMLLTAGVQEHQLEPGVAQQELLDLAKKLRIRRITREDAQTHIAEMAGYAVRPDGAMPNDVKQRIFAEGSRWGLTPDEVEPLIRQAISKHIMGRRGEQFRMVALVSGAAAILVGVLGMLAWMAFSRSLPGPETPPAVAATDDSEPPPATDGAPPAASNPPVARRLGVPAWWDEDLASYIANARLRMPALQGMLYDLRSPQSATRSTAYRKLVAAAGELEDKSDQKMVLAGLLAAAYASDPDESCAATIREQWIQLAAAAGDKLPSRWKVYDQSLWVARTAGVALLHPGLSPERSTELIAALEGAYQASLDQEAAPLELNRQIMTAAATHAYKSLARHAANNVDLAIDLHKRLDEATRSYVNAALHQRLATDYLAAVVPALGERWTVYEDLLRTCVQSEDPLNVLKLIELFEKTENLSLQKFLAGELITRSGLASEPRTVDELANASREALGVSHLSRPRDDRERLADWREAAAAALAEPTPAADDIPAILLQVVQLSRLSTLGAALAQGELGRAEFESLHSAKPRDLKSDGATAASTGSRAPRLNASQLKALDKYIGLLGNYDRLDKIQRLNYMRTIAGYAATLTDVQPKQGQMISRYLASAKPFDEHEQLMKTVSGILRWKMVRLGLADGLAESRLRTEHMQQLLEQALHRKVEMKDGWRDRMRGELLASVARELATEAKLSDAADAAADRAARFIAHDYETQAKLSGIAGLSTSSDSPVAVLQPLVEQIAARHAGSASPQTRSLIDRLPHELEAAQYVAPHDLARTVALERILFALLVARTADQRPASAAELAAIESDLQAADKSATHVIEQLFAGHRAMLRLWLITNPS